MPASAPTSATQPCFDSPHGAGESDGEGKERGRCPYPDCGKVFKDLKAHTLTHQSERPEKCPIKSCEFHRRGFARKYDKNRHTLTHYKGPSCITFEQFTGGVRATKFEKVLTHFFI
jgi:hypothetical protein